LLLGHFPAFDLKTRTVTYWEDPDCKLEFTKIDDNKSNGVFTEFINEFIKIKIQASGWPEENMNEQEKQLYVKNFKEREGIELDINEIKNNPGLRSIGKLVVNSFWGKMGQNPYSSQNEFIQASAM